MLHGHKVPMSNTYQISPIQGLQHDILKSQYHY